MHLIAVIVMRSNSFRHGDKYVRKNQTLDFLIYFVGYFLDWKKSALHHSGEILFFFSKGGDFFSFFNLDWTFLLDWTPTEIGHELPLISAIHNIHSLQVHRYQDKREGRITTPTVESVRHTVHTTHTTQHIVARSLMVRISHRSRMDTDTEVVYSL